MEAVERTIQGNRRIFIQAATGIGKTMAVLFPAVRSIAERAGAKVFYLTARTTGRLAAEKALEELRTAGPAPEEPLPDRQGKGLLQPGVRLQSG